MENHDEKINYIWEAVGLFFYIDDEVVFRKAKSEEAEQYGNCITVSLSHDDFWQQSLASKYNVDYDFYPRGRVVFDRLKRTFIVYIDRCLADKTDSIIKAFGLHEFDRDHKIQYDEHYQCYQCNPYYV